MPSFADSFWSTDYAGGLGVLFDKLQQGCVENEEVLDLVMARAEAESAYGTKLLDIRKAHAPKKEGFDHDEGGTVRKAYEGIVNEMGEEGKHHLQISESIRVMVLNPFRKWTDQHKNRVDYCSDFLRSKVKVYEQEGNEVQKIQRKYFNKCRLLDEARDADDSAQTNQASPSENPEANVPKIIEPAKENDTPKPLTRAESVVYDDQAVEPVKLGDNIYAPPQLKSLLSQMLADVPQTELKVPIIGTYDHVSTGADIVAWLIKSNTTKIMSEAELFGQDLIQAGLLRLVGQVGNKFLNSSQLHYQWKKLAYVRAGLEKAEPRDQSFAPTFVGEYLSGTINSYLNNPYPDETPLQKLERGVKEIDAKYREAVVRYDDARCSLEEAIVEHLTFMERCEADRLSALKQVFLDFLAPISNGIPAFQASIDKYLLFQETVKPERDLLYLVESYKTGGFSPKVPVYDNYYSPSEGWTFGVDLELRCRGDGKRIPLVVSTILRHLDNKYPELENDKVRLEVWTAPVPLKKVHELRKEINDGLPVKIETLQKYDPPVVASVLKLYLKELPESIIPSTFYDAVKTIYAEHGNDQDHTVRIQQVQATCGQLRVSQIAVLDALTKHFGRLMEIANPAEEAREELAQEMAPSILRPRVQTSVTLGDTHQQRLVRDLIEHRRAILTELKRVSSSARTRHTRGSSRSASIASVGNLPGAGSEDVALYQRDPNVLAPNTLNAQNLKVRHHSQPVELTDSAPVPVLVTPDAPNETSEPIPDVVPAESTEQSVNSVSS